MQKIIQKISQKEFDETPLKIIRKTIGMCNEVYELRYDSDSYILRMNKEKEWIYGTHKFLPLFQKLQIKTPSIIAEDYSKTDFPYCYQIQTKLEGKDLGWVIDELTPSELKQIAQDISNIFDKFNSLPHTDSFGGITGLNEEHHENRFVSLENHRKSILQRNITSQVIDNEIIEIHSKLLKDYKNYFLQLKPKIYYDDICSKNVMIHNGQFNGLVDLDFLSKGDYLTAIGTMIASWYGETAGETYFNEVIRLQKLNQFQQKIVKVYAILTLILWMSEEGIRFNSNSTGKVNWERVREKKRRIMELYRSIEQN